MAKSKVAYNNDVLEAEAELDTGAIDPTAFNGVSVDAFKKGFEKAAELNKQNIEALVESITAVTKGLEVIGSEAVSYTKQALEEGVKAGKALLAVKSPQDFATLQSDYTRAAFDQFVNQASKFNDLSMTAVKNAYAPINERVTAVSKLVQKTRLN